MGLVGFDWVQTVTMPATSPMPTNRIVCNDDACKAPTTLTNGQILSDPPKFGWNIPIRKYARWERLTLLLVSNLAMLHIRITILAAY